jgi:hypothetical protein
MRVRVRKIRKLEKLEKFRKLGIFRNLGETGKGAGRTGRKLEGGLIRSWRLKSLMNINSRC